jgi:hypothetical protein
MSHKTVNVTIPADDASLFDFRLEWLVAFHSSSRKFVTLCFIFHFS